MPYAEIYPEPSPRMLLFLATGTYSAQFLSCAHSSDQRSDWLYRVFTCSLIGQILYYVHLFSSLSFTNETYFVPADTQLENLHWQIWPIKAKPVVKYVNKRVTEW